MAFHKEARREALLRLSTERRTQLDATRRLTVVSIYELEWKE